MSGVIFKRGRDTLLTGKELMAAVTGTMTGGCGQVSPAGEESPGDRRPLPVTLLRAGLRGDPSLPGIATTTAVRVAGAGPGSGPSGRCV